MQKVTISKSIINRPDYLGEKFSRPMAWIDLLLTADETGSLSFTFSGLSSRWKWQRRDVKAFLTELQKKGAINCAFNCAFNCANRHPGRYAMLNLTICNIGRYTVSCTIDSIEQLIEQPIEQAKGSPLSPTPSLPNPPAPPYTLPTTPPYNPPSENTPSFQDAHAKRQKKSLPPAPFRFRDNLIGIGVEPKVADEWLQVRKAKKGINTETAFDAILREIKKAEHAGYRANDCISFAVIKSWAGFKWRWMQNELEEEQKTQPQSKVEQYMQTSANFNALVNEFLGANVARAGNGPANSPDEQ